MGVCRAVVVLATAALLATSLSAQGPLRTPWGDPDLQGIWPSGHMIDVPFERPVEFGTRAVLTDAEFAARAAELQRQTETDAAEFAKTDSGPALITPPSHWLERGTPSRQASLVVDPPDGRLPPMTEDGAQRARAWPSGDPAGGFPGPDAFTVYDRCITRGVLGSVFPNIYGSGTEILQAPGYVIIRYEMVHETRVIPLDQRPHLAGAMRSYMGDPRGRWDGDTLVVETTNFNGKTGSLARNGNGNPTSEALRLVERFTRRDADTLEYDVTVDDPRTWTRPWRVAFPLTRDPSYVLHEYACHEGNYAIEHMLRASRAAER
jgi:hypothetical protein